MDGDKGEGGIELERIPPEPFVPGVELHEDGGGATIRKVMTREELDRLTSPLPSPPRV